MIAHTALSRRCRYRIVYCALYIMYILPSLRRPPPPVREKCISTTRVKLGGTCLSYDYVCLVYHDGGNLYCNHLKGK
jgi:hypothetical protein